MLRRSATLAMLASTPLLTGCMVMPLDPGLITYVDETTCGVGCGCEHSCDAACVEQEWPVDPHLQKVERCLKKACRPDLGYERPPAVPLGPGPPGRFFPAPVRPAFDPRPMVSPTGYGPVEASAAGNWNEPVNMGHL